MWGDFMEKAKSMAANIDQQINESVGMDVGGDTQAELPKEDANGWSDDFDFGDEIADSPPTPKPETEVEKQPEPIASHGRDPESQEEQKQTADQPTNNNAAIEQNELLLAKTDAKSDIPLHPTADAVGEAVETASLISRVEADGSANDLQMDDLDNGNAVGDGWDQDDDGSVINAMEENEDTQQQLEIKEVKDGIGEEDASVQTGERVENQVFVEELESHVENIQIPPPINGAQLEAAKENSEKQQKSSSGLANLLSPAVGSLSFASPRSNILPHSSASATTKEETPTRSSNVTSLFSSIASAVDSALDSAVDKVAADPAVDKVLEEDGAWDDEDFDFPDEQSPPKETIVPQVDAGKEVESNENSVSSANLIMSTKEPLVGSFEEESELPKHRLSVLQPLSPIDVSVGGDVGMDPSTLLEGNIENDTRYKKLLQELRQREEQLAYKSVQLTQLQTLWESQEQELKQKLLDTKEEAKKRIQRAKERCEAAEARLKQNASQGEQSVAEKDQLIQDLRSEGEVLMRKQSQMEQAVRSANGEARQLRSKLSDETAMKQKAMEKLEKLEAELKETKESLKLAQKGESQASKLENDLLAARSDSEIKAATILSLQQKVKELVAEGKELKKEMEKSKKNAAQDALQERKNLRREHHDVIADLETKLRTTEREAGVREDALRHEVAELRKRWQDAVRRADALSMDVQSSTAPLLRQLESMERQNRARAAAWAELENRLRSELEETVIQNETLSRERLEFKTKYTRLERSANESEAELKESKRIIEDQTAKIAKLECKVEILTSEAEQREEEYQKVERLANEGVMRVRSEMTQTVVDSEERYRGQIEKLEADLRMEKEKRQQLQNQVEDLLENTGIPVPIPIAQAPKPESKPKRLRQAEGQAQILAGALGFEDSDDETDDGIIGGGMDRGDGSGSRGVGSFAALEQLTSRLKAAQVELESLRSNLRESERSRESLVKELAESRNAKEKLPLFEAKVQTLTEENREMELEIRGLRDDIADVRELYRNQLNVLLEEKTSHLQPGNGASTIPSNEAVDDDQSEAIASA